LAFLLLDSRIGMCTSSPVQRNVMLGYASFIWRGLGTARARVGAGGGVALEASSGCCPRRRAGRRPQRTAPHADAHPPDLSGTLEAISTSPECARRTRLAPHHLPGSPITLMTRRVARSSVCGLVAHRRTWARALHLGLGGVELREMVQPERRSRPVEQCLSLVVEPRDVELGVEAS